jgi:DNA-damage-inducible protein J
MRLYSSLEIRSLLCYNVAQGDQAMTNTVVRARIDEQVKEEASAVLATIGLTVSDAFRLMMMRIAKDKALPFEPLVPNAETVEAMKAARRGELQTAGSIDALLTGLDADD